ncbi:MAG TPA: GTP-binding protein, partial [Sphingomicrobium sp.]|nr:GTP-binding protein [Sphingomicrobium sp.]
MARVLDQDRELIATNVSEWLSRHERKEMLRFITCGSVDDGKSTLIGRLLYDCRQVFDDQLETLEEETK